MNTGLLLIMILALVLVEGVIIIAMLLSNEMRIKEALEDMSNYTEFISDLFKQTHHYEDMLSKEVIRYAGKCDEQTKRYKEFCEIAEKMCERYKEIETGHKELLNCWKGVDERYDQTYEQFKLLSDELKKINAKDERRICEFDENRLCPYVECTLSDCLYFVEESVKDPTLQDPIKFGGNKND